jgi:hypothetical protein
VWRPESVPYSGTDWQPDLEPQLSKTGTVPFRPQVQSRVTSDPELNLFAKSSWSQVAHEHATKQGAYLLLLNVS